MAYLLPCRSLAVATMFAAVGQLALGQGVDVVTRIVYQTPTPPSAKTNVETSMDASGVVVWLTPLTDNAAFAPPPHPAGGPFRLIQKDKHFIPHLLIIPTSASVDFPNLDPFFHNVFSLFNGKRFDLGLYEPGTSRSVRFDREGVSYIFCNIHPEMGAVIISLSTPFYAISNAEGAVTIHGVTPGRYQLHLWSENAAPADPAAPQPILQIASTPITQPSILLKKVQTPVQHKNKFGEDYLRRSDVYY